MNPSISPISAIATSEHTDEVEIAASITHSQGQPLLEPETENTTLQGAAPLVLDTLDTTTPKPKRLSTSKILGTFYDSYASIKSLILNCCHPLSFPKKWGHTTSISEQPLEVSTAIVNDSNQLQGSTIISQHEGPSENTTQHTPPQQPPQSLMIPYLESMPGLVPGTEGIVTASGISLPSNVSIPEDTVSHQPVPPEITGEPHGIANILSSAGFTGTIEKSG